MAKTTAPKGRRVKCQATGVWGTTLTYYKAPDGHWYKDEATYQDKLHKAAMHKQVIAALADVMMFDPSMAFPTIIPKKLKELSFYDDEIILATIEQCRDKIGYAMRTKEFSSEYGRAAYVMDIIKNHINDVYKAAKSNAAVQYKQEAKAQQVPILQDLGFGANTQDHHAHRDISDFLFDDEQE